ncbi:MAG: GtrA family protein [Rikenellaceae bacterium]
MKRQKVQTLIIKVTDTLYLPFIHRIVPLQTFRYALCGGVNMLLDAVLYFLFFHFLFFERDLYLIIVTISPQIAAFFITAPITFFTGLWLAKNISFQNSPLKDRTQGFRYLLVTISNFFIKYFGIKILVFITIYPSIANVMMTVVTVIFSYFMQKYFTFKGNQLT